MLTPQNHPFTAKPCFEEAASSFLEIMSEDEVVGSETSTQLLSEEQRSPHPEPDQPPSGEEHPGYVMLSKGTIIHCPKANMYIHNRGTHDKEKPTVTEKSIQTCTDGSDCALPCLGNDFMNQTYIPQAEPADGFKCGITAMRESGNLYTNLVN